MFTVDQEVLWKSTPCVIKSISDPYAIVDAGYDSPLMWKNFRVHLSELKHLSDTDANFFASNRSRSSILVVDDFYAQPDRIRDFALKQDYKEDLRYYKGLRSEQQFLFPGVREAFQKLLNKHISSDWTSPSFNGVFQITQQKDPLVYHSDLQDYAAAIYLTPNAPSDGGTSFWRHKKTGIDHSKKDDPNNTIFTAESVIDPNEWELLDRVAPKYNRLVIWDGRLVHSASSYEAYEKAGLENRLVQLFFFNIFDM